MLIKKQIVNLAVVSTIIVLAFLGILVSGCANISDVEATVARDHEIINAALDKSNLPTAPKNLDIIRMRDDIWIGDTSLRHKGGDLLPKQFERSDGITVVGNRAFNFFEVIKKIGDLTRIPIRYSEEVLEFVGEDDSSEEDFSQSVGIPFEAPNTMVLSYTGPLSELLDRVALRFNTWWRYEEGELFFFRTETKTFTVYALPSSNRVSSAVSSSGGGGGGASVQQSAEATLESWTKIKDTLQAIVLKSGTFVVDETSGTITVTTTPTNMIEVTKFINEQNQRLSRQIAINIKLLQVDISNTSRFGLDLKAAFRYQDPTGLTTTFTGPFTVNDPIGVNMAIVGATGKHWERWNDSTAIIDALATQGNVSLLTTSTVTTLNNKPAPIQVSRTQSYVRNITSTIRDSGSSKDVSIEPADMELGLTIGVLPRILDHGRVLLMFSMNLIELLNLEEFTTQDSTVQLPTIETRGFSQEIAMLSGSTLVLTGFEKVENNASKRGLGKPDFQLLGGTNSASNKKNVLVVLITPEVLESPLSPESRVSSF